MGVFMVHFHGSPFTRTTSLYTLGGMQPSSRLAQKIKKWISYGIDTSIEGVEQLLVEITTIEEENQAY